MIRLALVAIAGLSLSAVPAVAQSWGGTHDPSYRSGDRFSPYPTGYGERPYLGSNGARRSNAVPSNFDWRGQLDRPGDFRCDRFQDANQDDCGAGWRDQRRSTFFLDEIQLVPGWEMFVRRLLDTENIELFLSGSSAKLLSREVATQMRGRAMEAVVTPFSLREALRHAGKEPDRPADRLAKAALSQLDHALAVYLEHGGFPEARACAGCWRWCSSRMPVRASS